MRCLRRMRWGSQAGVSLVEMVVALTLFGSVTAVFGPVLTSSMESTNRVQNESRALDEVRVAMSRIDRELRSAECITTPVAGGSSSTLSFTTAAGSGGSYDVTYSVDAEGHLVRTVTAGSSTIGEGIVITSEEFRHTTNPGQRSSVSINLQVQFETAHSPRDVSTLIAARNAWDAC